MLVSFTVSPVSDPFSVRVSGNMGYSEESAWSRSFKISDLIVALETAGVSHWSAGELVETITRAQTEGKTLARTLEMSESEFARFMEYREDPPAPRRR